MRLSITRRSDLAIRAVRALDGRPDGLAGPELAGAIGSTRGFVAQIMVPLVRRRWVGSTPGRTGGYRLLDAGRQVSVLDVIEAIEGSTAAGHPLGGNEVRTCVLDPDEACALAAEPGRPTCDLHDAWLAAERTLIEQLRARPVLAARAPDPSSGSQS
jgi:Rrf2 family iron-sulfur cluster assembly transcriptional regulator